VAKSSSDPPPGEVVIRFGPVGSEGEVRSSFELDVERLELCRGGHPVELRPQAVRALSILLGHEGRLVPARELRRELWGSRHVEWRNGLHQVVRELRRALEDDARRPRFVETVPSLGYRFVGARIAPDPSDSADTAPPRSLPLRQALARRGSVAFAAGVATAVVIPAALLAACALFGG
jgi:DNA-binding winged helix-turn-helix (wHTH) protein